jgi:Papain family cysteine protease
LAETEVIVCENNGEMCSGGWPQDAFDYVVKNNGLPLESDMPYNADFLVQVSDQLAGNSDQLEYVNHRYFDIVVIKYALNLC